MASSSVKRIQNPEDTNQKEVFKALFIVYPDNPRDSGATVGTVKDIESRIAGFSDIGIEIENRAASNVRIYCDEDPVGDDKRWRPVEDISNDKVEGTSS